MLKLYEFPHSHYCEKVRWALDHKGIEWRARLINPGEHLLRFQRRFGSASLPIINDHGVWLQGSQPICLYLEQKYPQNPMLPDDEDLRRKCIAICEHYDHEVGDSLRRVLYEMLRPWPAAVQYYFTHRSGMLRRAAFRLSRHYVIGKIHQRFVGGQDEVNTARARMESAVETLSEQLSDQTFLVGDNLTLADISVASMFSILLQPPQHPVPWLTELPETISNYRNRVAETVAGQWALNLYAKYRPTGHGAYQRPAMAEPANLFI